MSIAKSCAAVIPCLNEAATIAPLVKNVLAHLPAVIVVDDGSTDGTARSALGAGAEVIRLPVSSGKGAALGAGFRRAYNSGFAWALSLDGDGQHAPSDIPVLLLRAEESGSSLVVGNRMGNAAAMPKVRRWVNRWMSRQLSTYCSADWPDSQCGFRLIHLASWSRFQFVARHFEVESEMLVRFARAGLRIDFAPVQTRYAGERSKIHPWRDTWRWFGWWRAIRGEMNPPSEPSCPTSEPVLDFK